jgi:hypothetical protein
MLSPCKGDVQDNERRTIDCQRTEVQAGIEQTGGRDTPFWPAMLPRNQAQPIDDM